MRPMVAVRATDRTVRASARSKEGIAGGPARLLRIIGKLFAEPQTLKNSFTFSKTISSIKNAHFFRKLEKLGLFSPL